MRRRSRLDGPPYTFYPNPFGLWGFMCGFFLLFLLISLVFSRRLLLHEIPFAFDTRHHAVYALFGSVCPVCSAYLLAFFGKTVFFSKPVLTIDESGWSVDLYGTLHVDWADIGSIAIPTFAIYSFIGVVLRDPEAYFSHLPKKLRRRAKYNQKTLGIVAAVPSQLLPISPEELFRITALYTSRKIQETQPPAPPILVPPRLCVDWSTKPQ